jgi:hypothetical protein
MKTMIALQSSNGFEDLRFIKNLQFWKFFQPEFCGLNENHSFRSYGFTNIAGAGLEPATFGL